MIFLLSKEGKDSFEFQHASRRNINYNLNGTAIRKTDHPAGKLSSFFGQKRNFYISKYTRNNVLTGM